MKLDVFNGGPKNNLTRLEPDQDVSGQFWRFVGNGDGTFRLSTLFRGPRMCLDIFNGGRNNNQPHLVRCGNFTGQLLGGGVAWPFVARAQQPPMPVVGFMSARTANDSAFVVAAFRRGLDQF
jgi:hypothetical protein